MRFFARPASPQPDDLCLVLTGLQPQASIQLHGENLWAVRRHLTVEPHLEFFLGERDGVALWVTVLDSGLGSGSATPLRTVLAQAAPSDAAALSRAVEYAHWLTTHRFCGRCGTSMERRHTEFAVFCPACGHEAWPAIHPCVIMLVHRGDQVLLARHARSVGSVPVFSCLAGYVEAGEQLEHTVAREVREEVGVEVGAPVYVESQAWPFPSQLMAGFLVPWVSGEPVPDGTEILAAGWFGRDNLPALPPPLSLARRLIRRFYNDPTL